MNTESVLLHTVHHMKITFTFFANEFFHSRTALETRKPVLMRIIQTSQLN